MAVNMRYVQGKNEPNYNTVLTQCSSRKEKSSFIDFIIFLLYPKNKKLIALWLLFNNNVEMQIPPDFFISL